MKRKPAKPKAPKLDPGPYYVIVGKFGRVELRGIGDSEALAWIGFLAGTSISAEKCNRSGYRCEQVKLVPVGRGKK